MLRFIRDVLCEDYVSFGAKGLKKGYSTLAAVHFD